jgi:hypothetical protein
MKLLINKISKEFSEFDIITTNDLLKLYKSNEPEVKRNTVNWRIYELVQRGILQRVAKGKFILGKEQKFVPVISDYKRISIR